jgi:oxygen-independent coproporphyrinogen-3 oxidase
MGTPRFTITEEILRRFDKPGPRYTSYPTAVEFHDGVGETAYRDHLSAADAQGNDAPLSLYTHLPFCEHRCLFCGCHVVITPHLDIAAEYLDYLKREIDMGAALLPARRSVAQLQWGGGTPTYFSPDQLTELFEHVQSYFTFQPQAEIAIEVDPRVTTREHLDRLVALGFNRLSMGVQDLTPEVQEAITRGQTLEQTRQLMEYARRVGFTEGINVDLIYGLPRQRFDTFDENLSQIIDLRPDRVAVYSFAYVPWIKGHQKKLDESELPSPELKFQLYLRAMERFLEAGYEPIGMDHFALPDDELAEAARNRRLHRNFMGYTVKPASDMVAFGISGIGDVQRGYFQNEKKLSTYYEAIDAGRLPVAKGYLLDEDDRLRRYVITQLMCNFHVEKSNVADLFGVDFDEYFAKSLEQLAEPLDAGFVEISDKSVTVTDSGRLFVRNVCMAFDRYMEAKKQDKPIFSRTV